MISQKHENDLAEFIAGGTKITLFNVVQIVAKIAIMIYDIINDLKNQKVSIENAERHNQELQAQLDYYRKEFEKKQPKNVKTK